jgi:hypothetical protein
MPSNQPIAAAALSFSSSLDRLEAVASEISTLLRHKARLGQRG